MANLAKTLSAGSSGKYFKANPECAESATAFSTLRPPVIVLDTDEVVLARSISAL